MAQSAADGDLEDSNVSSPLSEMDDKDGNDEEVDKLQIERGDDDNSSLSGDENAAGNDGSDAESELSDAHSDANSEANDTEAETERLYDTPRNQRQKDVVVDQYNNGEVFEHTPSKLRRAATLNDDLTNPDDASVSGDDASDASSGAEVDESPSKRSSHHTLRVGEDSRRESQDRKRKRSFVADQSESDQPLRKRTGSVGAASIDVEDEIVANDEDKATETLDSAAQSGAEEDEGSSNDRDTGTEGEGSERATRSTKKTTRSKLKHSELATDADDTGTDAPDEAGEEEANEQLQEEEMDADAEEEADAAAKNIEECRLKRNC
jgi:hypothetical protein